MQEEDFMTVREEDFMVPPTPARLGIRQQHALDIDDKNDSYQNEHEGSLAMLTGKC